MSDPVDREIADHCRAFQALKGVGRQRGCDGCEAGEDECWATIALPCSRQSTAYAHIGTLDYGSASRESTMTGHNSCGKYPDEPAASILFLESLSAII